MTYAEQIAQRVSHLSEAKQAEILRYVQAVEGSMPSAHSSSDQNADTILRKAWGAWGRSSIEEIDKAVSLMRNEWERDLFPAKNS